MQAYSIISFLTQLHSIYEVINQEFSMIKQTGDILVAMLLVLAVGCDTSIRIIQQHNSTSSITHTNGVLTITLNGETPIEGSGKTAVADRIVEEFQHLHVCNAVEVVVDAEGLESATVEADDNLLSLVETKVERGILRIGIKASLKTRNPLRVRVSAKRLESLTAESSAKVISEDLKGDNLVLSASSSGQITANKVDATQLNVSVNSSGTVTASGLADRQTIEASSSGRYAGRQLVSRVSEVVCSSSASMVVHSTEEIRGSVTSSGKVRYSGNPSKIEISTNS